MRQINEKHLNKRFQTLFESKYFGNVNEQHSLTNFRFNDGRFNKAGANTIYYDNEPIVDFGVGQLGDVTVGDQTYEKSIYLKGGFNAASQGRGLGALGVNFIFAKLPKIQHLILQCYDTACPFWLKMGGFIETSADITGSGKLLHTVVIPRDSFMSSKYNQIGVTQS